MISRMRIAFAITVALIVCLCVLPTFSAGTLSQESTGELRLIQEFDDCLQQRFKEIDKSFGFRRIIRPGDTPHRFKSENAKELAAVGKLKVEELTVALYLTSRSVLGEKPNEKEWAQGQTEHSQKDKFLTPPQYERLISRRLIKGPVIISGDDKGNLPLPIELWDQSRNAMNVFEGNDSYQFSQGGWQFVARPVRASEQSCLGCHLQDTTRLMAHDVKDGMERRLRLGDPLGVLLYAYRKAR